MCSHVCRNSYTISHGRTREYSKFIAYMRNSCIVFFIDNDIHFDSLLHAKNCLFTWWIFGKWCASLRHLQWWDGAISFAKLVKGRLSCSLPIISMVGLSLNSLSISSMIFQTLPFVLHFFCWSTQCRLRIAFSPCSQTDAATARNNWDAIFASESLFVPVLWSASVQIVTGREHRSFVKMK